MMSESAKTLSFVGVGIAAVVLALVTRPSSAELDVDSLVGTVLTEKFASPEDAKRLRIARFDENSATLSTFEVAERNGVWTLPSKDGYPADATRQMAQAATSLMDRKILEVKGDNAADHADFGVLDPLSPSLKVGQTGIGTRVTVFDAQDSPRVDLIIGKEANDQGGQRYVREASHNLVYVIEIDPSRLSTNFADWIEKDLLKFNPLDLQQVQILDYTAMLDRAFTLAGELVLRQIGWDPRAELTLDLDDEDSTWNASRLRKYDPQLGENGDYVDVTLADDEELNVTALNGLKDALVDLTIVDVVRKPDGLSDDLKAGDDFLKNDEALKSLVLRGFAPDPRPGKEQEMISSDGEVIATMKNGVEYVLRFGDLKRATTEQQEANENAAEKDPAAGSEGVNRYLFVMARFNEAAVKQPELEVPPDLPAGAAGEGESEGESVDETAGESDSADGDQPPFVPQAEGDAAADETETPAETETATADVESDATESTVSSEPATEQTDQPSELDKAIAERKRIEADNQRKLDEYQATLKEGREKVSELNARFGDWYFVVSDDVFQKIRLGLDDVIKKKEATDESDSANGESSDAASNFGAPGTPIPGLPEIPSADDE